MEQKLEKFKGLGIASFRRELEIPNLDYLRTAKNVVIGNDGSLYAHTGNITRATPPAAVHRMFYSRALNRYIAVNGTTGTLYVYSIDVNGVWSLQTTHTTVIPEGTDTDVGFGVQLVDWPLTSVAYLISGGTGTSTLSKLSASGVTFSSITLPSDIATPNVICVHKDTLWLAKGNKLFPSADLLPETFDASFSYTISKGEVYVTGLASMGGVLYAHKWDSISGVIGDTFTGTAADALIIDIDVSVGTLRPSALCVYRNFQWYQGPGGYYVFNGEKTKLLSDRLLLQPIRKLA